MSDTTIISANYQAIPALSAMFIEAYANNEAMQAALRNDEAAEFAHDAYWRWALGESCGGQARTRPTSCRKWSCLAS
jgi:hypothetical protein